MAVIEMLVQEFTRSPQPNHRKVFLFLFFSCVVVFFLIIMFITFLFLSCLLRFMFSFYMLVFLDWEFGIINFDFIIFLPFFVRVDWLDLLQRLWLWQMKQISILRLENQDTMNMKLTFNFQNFGLLCSRRSFPTPRIFKILRLVSSQRRLNGKYELLFFWVKKYELESMTDYVNDDS